MTEQAPWAGQWASVCVHESLDEAEFAHPEEELQPWPPEAQQAAEAEARFWRAVARRQGECLVAIEQAVAPEGVRLGYQAMTAMLEVRRLLGKTGRCRCGHWDGEHFDEVKWCNRAGCECARFIQETER